MADRSILNSLFDESDAQPLSVSELNEQVKGEIERRFSNVWVEGEISNFHAAASGHWYFTLTDGNSLLKAACYKGQNYRIRFKPTDGLQVRVRGRLTLYAPRGEYQILVESLEPVGEGALTVAFEQIKAKLAKEGLFDEALKRPLPAFPRKVGVVTSATGAAFHDIRNVLTRRARSVGIMLIPTLVQGEYAAAQIAAAIESAADYNEAVSIDDKIDVLIVGRGGGSAEDLWAFNEEIVARAIRASAIPVISAVGHEIDFSISDLTADLRAPTPSAAAELVAKAESEIGEQIERNSLRLMRSIDHKFLLANTELQSLSMSPVFVGYPNQIERMRQKIEDLEYDLHRTQIDSIRDLSAMLENATAKLSPVSLAEKVGGNRTRLAVLSERANSAAAGSMKNFSKKLNVKMATLDALSPLSVLGRGYSITQLEWGMILRDPSDAAEGDKLNIRLEKGSIRAKVIDE